MGRLIRNICFSFLVLSSAALAQSSKNEFFRPAPMPLPLPPSPQFVEGAPIREATVDIQLSAVAATTIIDLTLGNSASVPRGATVNLPIAAGQQMARFALDFNGHLRYAVAIEKARGREVFEAVERRRVDPALLEKTEGDNFRLRVFPIMPQGTRKARFELIQSAAGELVRISPPSDALSKLDHFAAKLHISGDAPPEVRLGGRTLHAQAEPGGFVVMVDDHQWSNAMPIEVRRHVKPVAVAIDAAGKDRWLVADVPVPAAAGARRIASVVQLLWDSSGSHTQEAADLEIAELDSYFKAMGNGEVHLQRLRDQAEPMQRFTVSHGDWTELREALRKTVYDGATALDNFTVEPEVSEILLVSDGLSNYDSKAFPHLAGNQHLFALSAATSANRDFLNAICAENHGRFVAIDTSRPTGSGARLLTVNAAEVDIGATDGVSDVKLDRSEIAQGHVHVAARAMRDSGRLTLLVSAGGRSRQEVSVVFDDQTTQQNDLGVFWARYSIAELAAIPDHHAAVRRIGERFQLATDETSLLVLESAADYVHYNVTAPSDLRDEVARMGQSQTQNQAALQAQHLESIVQELKQKKAWYDASYQKHFTSHDKTSSLPTNPPVTLNETGQRPLPMAATAPLPPPMMSSAPISVPAPALQARPSDRADASADRVTVTGANLRRDDTETASAAPAMSIARSRTADPGNGSAIEAKKASGEITQADTIHLQPYLPDSPYGQRLRAASAAELYAIYLDERPDYQASPAFYLDVADLLFAKAQTELGLRVPLQSGRARSKQSPGPEGFWAID